MEPLRLDHRIRNVGPLQSLVRADNVLAIGYFLGGQKDQTRPSIPNRSLDVWLLGSRHETVAILPVDRLDHGGVRADKVRHVVVVTSSRPDERFVSVVGLGPGAPAAENLDKDRLRAAVVRNAVDLIREGKVDRRDFAVLDVAQDIRQGLARRHIDRVESADGVGRSANLETVTEALTDELCNERQDVRPLWVVGSEQEGRGDGIGRDAVSVFGVLALQNVCRGEVVGRDG